MASSHVGKMMRIAFEINDKGFHNIDLSKPIKGNPGVGGTWYEFALVIYALKEYGKRNDELVIYHYNDNVYPEGILCKRLHSENELFRNAKNDSVDLLVFKTEKNDEWYKNLSNFNINSIAWSHTFMNYPERKNISKCNQVKRMICVGKEHYDSYLDEDIINKTDYIYNMVAKTDSMTRRMFGNEVTYIGSIIPAKSFHVLASVWRDIIKEIPDAKLNVIGSGKLYQQNCVLGPYGIADEKYERSFIKYLTDDNGNILSSVNFMGNLGAEKKEIILNTAVGVVNPTTKSETFCISAVEFEQYGVPVCSGKKNGLLDTVSHKESGLLSNNKRQLKKNIIKLLKDDEYNIKLGEKAKKHSALFLPETIVPEWERCLTEIEEERECQYYKPTGNFLYNGKIVKCLVRFFRFKLKLKFIPSIGQLEEELYEIYSYIRSKFKHRKVYQK